ncbi:hypothetical protein C8F04DRAFT_1173787 [Mycena alexandri]|uniref:Xylanolytic transcriptional activator regulatory domain-containing protein n=1 Tax=Mycena alexandri TaxID=1745969 RepID=A0AAD6TKE4_9AGAR|nr:hypothetical protein C8F04DRAFT_1173787 [Mycena alexandri]
MTLNDVNGVKAKQRRSQNACDARTVCKKRKIRCREFIHTAHVYSLKALIGDGAKMPGNRCSGCLNAGLDCTHADLMKFAKGSGVGTGIRRSLGKSRREDGATPSQGECYECLRINVLTDLQLLPGIDFTEQLDNENEIQSLLQQHVEKLPRNDEEVVTMLSKLKLSPENNRFFGKSSSGVQLLQTALEFHKNFSGLREISRPFLPHKREDFWAPVPLIFVQWVLPPPHTDTPEYNFPDDDLILTLVDLYFQRINPCWPVLHRPTFDRKVSDKLHLRDARFAATLLIVVSLGARHSNDHRIRLEGSDIQSAGWEWYSQVSVVPKYLIYKPDLYELQVFALSVLYLQSISSTALGWNHIGLGLRRAQDVGAHRRRAEPPTAETEQWKRVFCFDQDLPIDVDDEYWDLPGERKFKQPNNKPSEISYFICYAKLLELQAAIATTMYSPRRPKNLSSNPFPPTEAQSIVAFDSALNSWLSNIPEHLRWDPERQNKIHLMQSVVLNTAFYNVQILLHRPYIPAPFQVSPPGALPSLAICTNAARACIRIFDAYTERGGEIDFNMLLGICAAGIVLVLSTWSGKKSGSTTTPQQLEQIRSCIRLITEAEKRREQCHISFEYVPDLKLCRYRAAGRYSDIMNRLLYAGANLDSLFDIRPWSTLPPSAQRGHEALSAKKTSKPEPDPRYYLQPYVEHECANLDPLRACAHQDYAYPQSDPMFNLEHVADFDIPQFTSDVSVNADVVNMWSTAPSGFHVDDWSYIMSKEMSPQFESLITMPPPRQETEETLKLHSELCGEEGLKLVGDLRGRPEEARKFHKELCGFWAV